MLKIQHGVPLPYCVELPRASDEQRREQGYLGPESLALRRGV